MNGVADRALAERRWEEYMAFAGQHSHSDWMFRGVTDKDRHLLVPKIGRASLLDSYNTARERAIFRTFKRRAGLDLDRMPAGDLEWLALAQHHGLPTRLLDWTSNPLVAAFFAISGNAATAGRVYAVRVSRLAQIDATDETTPDPFDGIAQVTFVVPSAHVRRIAQQRGFFTIHPRPNLPWNPYRSRRAAHDHQFDIGSEMHLRFQQKLFHLGVTSSSIMDDLDGLARTLEWQYRAGIAVGKLSY